MDKTTFHPPVPAPRRAQDALTFRGYSPNAVITCTILGFLAGGAFGCGVGAVIVGMVYGS